jgi:class 3 adenylate cyclase/pimeloyl-ACP methyl ester carboxylesterase
MHEDSGRMDRVQTRYARSGSGSIAFHVIGDGPVDLVYAPGPASHVELMWSEPVTARYLRRITSFARLVMFDRRGTGLSDAVDSPPTLEQQMDDVRAVVRAVGIDRAALFGVSDAGLCALYAATYPDEISVLVLWGVAASGAEALDPNVRATVLRAIEEAWGTGGLLPLFAPSRQADSEFFDWWARYERAAASPGMARMLLDLSLATDISEVLPSIRVPTLVLHREGDAVIPVELGGDLAARIPDARFVKLPGTDNYPWSGDVDSWFGTFEEFLTGSRHAHALDRVLATVLFTDIVASTRQAADVGDAAWRELLEDHNSLVRDEFRRWRGREVKATGDGFLATFDGPARAVRCAQAISRRVRSLGIEIRAAVHTGECETLGDDIGGIAVHIASRIAGLAEAGQVLVSSTVRDLVVGSGLEFADAGSRELKGVPGTWHLYFATDQSGIG